MKLPAPVPVEEMAQWIEAEIQGNLRLQATGINEIHQVEVGDVTFVDAEKYYKKSLNSAATIIIIDRRVKCPDGKALLIHPQPFEAYNSLVLRFRPYQPLTQAISESAEIHPTAILEPGVVVGHHARIGKDCYLQANVTIGEYTVLEEGVRVQNNSVIGSEAFYFKKTASGYRRWRTAGRVVLEREVEVGAGCTINSGVSGDTIIGAGSKLDCQIQIGHDVKIGKRCLLAAQVGIGGNTVIGDDVVLYGQVGVAQNLRIGDKAMVSAKAGVSKDLEGHKAYFGVPAAEAREKYRELAALRHLPEFFANYYRE